MQGWSRGLHARDHRKHKVHGGSVSGFCLFGYSPSGPDTARNPCVKNLGRFNGLGYGFVTMTYSTNIQVTLDNALYAHQRWKVKLKEAVESGEQLDVEKIRRDDCCDLGKWLHSDGRAKYGHTPEFIKLFDTHEEFHLITSVVAMIINVKEYKRAKAMLEGSSQFSSASTDVALAIFRLKSAVLAMSD